MIVSFQTPPDQTQIVFDYYRFHVSEENEFHNRLQAVVDGGEATAKELPGWAAVW
jgi:hypothetical protein